MIRRLSKGLLQAAALAAALFSPCAAPAQGVFIPRFDDPAFRMDKPDLGPLRRLRFLTDEDYPPFHFTQADGSLAGLNVDLARALCEELSLSCTIQARRWDTLIDALARDEGDAAIASLAITDALKRRVDFTLPYYRTPARFVVRDKSLAVETSPAALAGRRIGVEGRSAHEDYLRTFFPRADIRAYASQEALRTALRTSEVDFAFGDGIAFALWLNGTDSAGCCRFEGGPFTESRWFGEGVGIAVRKEDAVVRRALDWALLRVSRKGVFADLYLRYFPIGFY